MHTLIVPAATIAQLRIMPITWTDVLTLVGIAALICSVRSLVTTTPVAHAMTIVTRTIPADRAAEPHSPIPSAQWVGTRVAATVSPPPAIVPGADDLQRRRRADERATPGLRASEIAALACLSMLAVAFAALFRQLSSAAARSPRDLN